jgi:dTDP-4-dehydrorhamnose 3,5-epimerase
MQITRFAITGPVEITPRRHADSRGYFSETFNLKSLQEAGIPDQKWVQDNQSLSLAPFTLRGLHLQVAPTAQAKLVRVLKGAIFDVAVDLRPNSPTRGKWIATTLSAERFNQLYVPEGFAHGFLTLEPACEVLYKVTAPYAKADERSLRWNDPDFAIAWPLPVGTAPILSDKDAEAPLWRACRDHIGPVENAP